MRTRDPVDDLPLTGARRRQARMVERDAEVDDPDRDAAAVEGGVGERELRRAGVTRGHVRVDARRRRGRRRLRRRIDGTLRPRILERDDLVQIDSLDRVERRDRLDLVGGDAREHVAEAVVAVQDRAALRLDAPDDVAVGASLGGDDQNDTVLAGRLRLRKQLPIVLREAAAAGAVATGECCRACQDDDRKRGDYDRAKGARRNRSHLFLPCFL